MKNTVFGLANWMLSDPRRVVILLSVIMVVLTVTFAVVPNGVVLAEDIIGGS